MKKVIFGVLAVSVLAAGAIFVVAQKQAHTGGHGFGMGRGGHMIEMALRGLDLTDEQKAKVKEIMAASRVNVEPLMQQIHDNHAKIGKLGIDGKFDQAQVETLAAEQSNIMAKLIVEKEKAKTQVFAILTDEQKAKAEAMRTKFEERLKDKKGFSGKHSEESF